MGFKFKNKYLTILLSCTLLPLCSCFSIQKAQSNFIANSFEQVVESLYTQSDPELVKQAFPTLLILLDSLILSSPDNSRLLYAATLAYGTYCQAFLSNGEDQERASKLFAKAKDYGFKLLGKNGILYNIETSSLNDIEGQLDDAIIENVPYLFATGSAWLGWILTNLGSMEAIADLSKAIAIMNRVIELDETYNDGAVHLVFGIYYCAQPRGAGQDLEKGKFHFDRAIEISGEGSLMAIVTFAEYYARALLDEESFTSLLGQSIKTDLTTRPEIRLLNEIAIQRAKYLLENKGDLF